MRIFLSLLLLIAFSKLEAQSPSQLEKQRKALTAEIQKTTRLLRSAQRTRAAAVSDLRTLQVQIENRAELLKVVRTEMELIQKSILRKQALVHSLGEDLEHLKSYYHELLRQLHRYSNTQNTWLFIWSAPSLNKAYERWQYLKRLEDHRLQQVNYIKSTREALQSHQAALEQRLAEKQLLLELEQSERQSLNQALQRKGAMVKDLKTKESSLRQTLTKKEEAQQHLNSTIEDVVRSEMRIAQKRAERYPDKEPKPKPSPKPAPPVQETAEKKPPPSDKPAAQPASKPKEAHSEEEKLAWHEEWKQSFRSSRGKMPNPINDGVVVSRFGRQQHPVFSTVQTVNNGLDIQGTKGSSVRAVHAGEVVSVFTIPSMGKAVMLKHGPYFTTYSNLNSVQVRRGERVKARQALGDLRIDPESGAAVLHFELWKGRTKFDPIYWLE